MSELVTISPIDGQVLVRRAHVDPSELQRMAQAASTVQQAWAQRPLADRLAVLTAAVDIIVSRSEQLALDITRQMGRPLTQTPGEIKGFAERARYMLSVAEQALTDIRLPAQPPLDRWIEREPLGLVLTIAPWNYPLLTAVNCIVPALAAGNAVLLKHSDQTPLCAEALVDGFQAAGLPEGLFQFVHADHGVIASLIESGRVDYVAFTGSVRGGAAIEAAAAGRFIGRGLELGGNDPAYVRADADLAQAADTLVDGAFYNAGQSCCGIQRIYVDRARYPEFLDRAVALTEQYRLGNPLDPETTLGPLVRARAADEVRATVAESLRMGARDCIDARRFPAARAGTPYLAPSILAQVDHGMPIMNDECFGPVVGIMPVDTDEQAVALMNDSPYGLTAAVFTQDIERARLLGRQVRTGTFFMNRCDYLDPALAWTGVKNTGHGVSLSILGYQMLTRVKSYHLRGL